MGRKRQRRASEITRLGGAPIPAVEPITGTAQVAPAVAAMSLDEIRREALAESARAAQTIARLEAWRIEIDATIAFLRSQRRTNDD